jgi:hypothetical protein
MSEKLEQPAAAFPLESPEKWAKLNKLAAADDTAKLKTGLAEMGLSPALAPIFVAAVAEEKELSEIVRAGNEPNPRYRELIEKSKFLAGVTASTLKEAQELTAAKLEIMAELPAFEVRAAAARQAMPMLPWLHEYFPELFGRLPSPHRGVLSATIEAAKTARLLRDAGFSNLYEVGTWRQNAEKETMAEKRRRIYSSFSPKPPDTRR